MKHKIARIILSTALTVSMMGTTCFAAELPDMDKTTAPNTDSTITGDSTVEEPVYKVLIPTSEAMSFVIDAFEQKDKGQIISGDIACVNKSNVAIQLTVDLKMAQDDGTTPINFKTSEADVSTEIDKRDVFMKAVVADKTTGKVIETLETGAAYKKADDTELSDMYKKTVGGKDIYYADADIYKFVTGEANTDSATAVTDEMEDLKSLTVDYNGGKEVALGTNSTKLQFALDKSEYIEYFSDSTDITATSKAFKKTAASAASTACFTLSGKVNPSIVWQDGDYKVVGVYSFIGMQTSAYDAAKTGFIAHALMPANVAPAFTAEAGSTSTGVIKFTVGEGNAALANNASSKPDITAISIKIDGTSYDVLNPASANLSDAWLGLDGAQIDETAGTITIEVDKLTSAAGAVVDGTEVTISYKNEEGDVETAKVTLID